MAVSSVLAASPAASQVVHIVQSGETLAAIALRYGISQAAILQANHLSNPNFIWVGQRLIIPTERQISVTGSRVYTVRPGDTLAAIAARFGTTVPAIAAANPSLQNTNYIWVGQRLIVPRTANSAGMVRRAATYTVQPGDTLAAIAARFGTTVPALTDANKLSSPSYIYVGQILRIPSGTLGNNGGGLRFVVSTSQQRCRLYQGNSLLYDWRCSTGRYGAATKPGSYHVQSKLQKAYGSTWNIWMPYWLGIYWAGSTENGIHGLPWNATTGVQLWSGYVGTPVTFGCIMLDNTAARTLYNLAYIGMPVEIKY